MNLIEINKKSARDLVGKNIRYNNQVCKVLDYKVTEVVVKLVTDQKAIVFLIDDAQEAFKDIEIVESKVELAVKSAQLELMPTVLTGGSANQLKQILMDNITSIRTDVNYVAQAKEVNASVKALIDLAKAECEIFRMMRG